jgi:hypothetical protein
MNKDAYEQAFHDLELRRARCQDELIRVERAITALHESIDIPPITETVIVVVRENRDPHRFANMSVRWAVLKFLAQEAAGPRKTAEIADALERGGNPRATKTAVSAVISDMVNRRSELEQKDDGYQLTQSGKMAWAAIEHSARYENRANSPSAS